MVALRLRPRALPTQRWTALVDRDARFPSVEAPDTDDKRDRRRQRQGHPLTERSPGHAAGTVLAPRKAPCIPNRSRCRLGVVRGLSRLTPVRWLWYPYLLAVVQDLQAFFAIHRVVFNVVKGVRDAHPQRVSNWHVDPGI